MKDRVLLLLTGLEIVGFGLAAFALRDWHLPSRLMQTELVQPITSPDKSPAPADTAVPARKDNAATQAQGGTPESTKPSQNLFPQAYRLFIQGRLDESLTMLDSIIKNNSDDLLAYNLRGSIYCQKKLWDQARQDFTKALAIDGKNSSVKFNLVEIDFMQKNYDKARPGFTALQKDADVGDVSAYRVFLCDLFGGHRDLASQELSAFDAVGSNPSYYYSHVAWDLYNKNTEDARGWLTSALGIYSPAKNELFASSLKENGYLPLPPANLQK